MDERCIIRRRRAQPRDLSIDGVALIRRQVHPHGRVPQHEGLTVPQAQSADERQGVLLHHGRRYARGDVEGCAQALEAVHVVRPDERREQEPAVLRRRVNRVRIAADALDEGRQDRRPRDDFLGNELIHPQGKSRGAADLVQPDRQSPLRTDSVEYAGESGRATDLIGLREVHEPCRDLRGVLGQRLSEG